MELHDDPGACWRSWSKRCGRAGRGRSGRRVGDRDGRPPGRTSPPAVRTVTPSPSWANRGPGWTGATPSGRRGQALGEGWTPPTGGPTGAALGVSRFASRPPSGRSGRRGAGWAEVAANTAGPRPRTARHPVGDTGARDPLAQGGGVPGRGLGRQPRAASGTFSTIASNAPASSIAVSSSSEKASATSGARCIPVAEEHDVVALGRLGVGLDAQLGGGATRSWPGPIHCPPRSIQVPWCSSVRAAARGRARARLTGPPRHRPAAISPANPTPRRRRPAHSACPSSSACGPADDRSPQVGREGRPVTGTLRTRRRGPRSAGGRRPRARTAAPPRHLG